MKILILKPSSLGDVVLALPVLRLLKLHYPESEIYWWIDAGLAPLLEGDPDLAGLVRFERKRWASPEHWPEMYRSVRWMRRQSFDLVLDLQCLLRSGIFAWLANGKLLIGLDERREGARGFYDLAVRRDPPYGHATEWYVSVLKPLNVPIHWNFDWLPKRADVAAKVQRDAESSSGVQPRRGGVVSDENTLKRELQHGARWIVLQPGARWLNKRWPIENYAEVVRRLSVAHPDFRFAILGSREDSDMAAAITRVNPKCCEDLTGKISLLEMIEWIRLSELMIANDSGPMHVAAALGKPIVAMFGPTDPRDTGPFRQLHNSLRVNLPCSPCQKPRCTYFKPMECLKAISVDRVFQHAEKLLAAAGQRSELCR